LKSFKFLWVKKLSCFKEHTEALQACMKSDGKRFAMKNNWNDLTPLSITKKRVLRH